MEVLINLAPYPYDLVAMSLSQKVKSRCGMLHCQRGVVPGPGSFDNCRDFASVQDDTGSSEL
jgi:hypothetical protein